MAGTVTRSCAACRRELAPPPVALLHCACGADLSRPDAVITVRLAIGASGRGISVKLGAVDVGPGRPARRRKQRP